MTTQSSHKHILKAALLFLLLTVSTVNSAVTAGQTYYIQNKSGAFCLWNKITRTYTSYGDCTVQPVSSLFGFTLTASGTNWIIINAAGQVLDLDNGTDPTYVVNWNPVANTDSQKWTLSTAFTIAGVDYYTLKNVAKGKCLTYDAAKTQGDSGAVAHLTDCPADGAQPADKFLFAFNIPKVTVKGYIRYSTTNGVVPATVWNTAGFVNKITFKNADGSIVGDATIDANASTYTISVVPNKTYTIVSTVYELEQVGSPMTIAVAGEPIDGVTATTNGNTAVITATTVKVKPYTYTWKLQLSWNNKVKDLDLYVQSSMGTIFYGRKTSQFVNYMTDVKDQTTPALEELVISPTATDTFYVYVKNRGKEALLKETEAKVKITKTRGDGANMVTLAAVEVTVPTTDTDAKNIYWNVMTITAASQSYVAGNKVCATPECPTV
jgi:hypothetical protein